MRKNIEMMYFTYGLAIEYLNHKFLGLYKVYSQLDEANPIAHLKYRIKSKDSIKGKLLKLKKNSADKEGNFEFSVKNINNLLDDICGYRVVCPFLSDVYKVIEDIRNLSGIIIVEERDYIKEPKASGYASYHFKILVPVQLQDNQKQYIKAEIQVRTSAMDLATLEHGTKYKTNEKLPENMLANINEMYSCCHNIDRTLNSYLPTNQRKKSKNLEKTTFLPLFIESDEFKKVPLKEQETLKFMNGKINEISANLLRNEGNNPIEHVKYQFGQKKNNANDITGIRIVCPFIDNIDQIIEELQNCEGLEIIEAPDHRNNPESNGNYSRQLLVAVPITINGETTVSKVEIQIRTMIQEIWANFEERLSYPKKLYEEDQKLAALFKKLADLDDKMNKIYQYSKGQQTKNKLKGLAPPKKN